jgi:hypothetical protein
VAPGFGLMLVVVALAALAPLLALGLLAGAFTSRWRSLAAKSAAVGLGVGSVTAIGVGVVGHLIRPGSPAQLEVSLTVFAGVFSASVLCVVAASAVTHLARKYVRA